MTQLFDAAFERHWAEYVKEHGLVGQKTEALQKQIAYDQWLLFHPLAHKPKPPEPPGFKFSEALTARFNGYVKSLREAVDMTKHPELARDLIDLISHAQMEAVMWERSTFFDRFREEWSDTLRVHLSVEPRKEQK